MRVLTRGAGVAGLTVAHELASRDIQVDIVDKATAPTQGASWFAGGMLAPFCERESADETVLRLGRSAADWWDHVLPGLISRNGTLVVAPPRDTAELARFANRTSGYEWLDEDGIARLEPDLAGRFRKGLFFAEEAHLDPRLALTRLYEKLAGMGVTFHFGGSQPPSNLFNRIVDCTGSARIGDLPDLRGVRGEMLYLASEEVHISRPVRLLHPRIPLYVVPRKNGRFMVGATMIETDTEGPVSARSMMELLNAAYTLHPAFAEATIVETGTGVRPAFPDNLPKIVTRDDCIFINGAYRHGFLLSPAIARQAADLISGTATIKDIFDETSGQRRRA